MGCTGVGSSPGLPWGCVAGSGGAQPPPCHATGRGAADPPPAVRAVHRVPGEAGGAVHQRQPRARRGRGGPCLPAGAHQAAGLLLQVRPAPAPPTPPGWLTTPPDPSVCCSAAATPAPSAPPTCSSSSSWCRTCTPARAPRRSSAPRCWAAGWGTPGGLTSWGPGLDFPLISEA